MGATAIALAGCGGATKTVIVQGPPTGATPATGASQSVPATQPAPAATASTTATGTETATKILHMGAFQTPSGNIGCMIVGAIARCDIVRRSWSPPSRPASCPSIVNFGQGLEVGVTGSARFVCAGDTVREPAAAKLPYGTATQMDSYECVSQATGLTCTNRQTAHGFMLSVQRYRLF